MSAVPNVSPPQYTSDRDPLLPSSGEHSDIPDDFKIGVSVRDSDVSIRMAFVRKVYFILTLQLLGTTGFSAFFMFNDSAKLWIHSNPGVVFASIISTVFSLLVLICFRQSHPINLILLTLFTAFESVGVANIVTFYDSAIVLQALVLTLGIFIALTLFTFQSKIDFSGWGPFLYSFLWIVILVSIMGIFFPFGRTGDLLLAFATAVLFCGYILFDTYMIINQLSPDEYIIASVDLYLDIINLFLNLLRILQELQSD